MKRNLLSITKNSGFLFFSKIFSVILGFIFNLLAARVLGPNIYGRFMYLFSIFTVLSYLVSLGLENGLVYFIPKFLLNDEKEKTYVIIKFLTYLLLFISFVITIFLFINAKIISTKFLNNSGLTSIFKYSVFLVNFLLLKRILGAIFRAHNKMKNLIVSNFVIFPVVKIIALICLFLMGIKKYNIVFSYYVAGVIILIYLVYNLEKNFKLSTYSVFKKIQENKIAIKNILIFSVPLLFSGLLHLLMLKTDLIMIGYFLGEKKVGIYSIAMRTAILGTFFLGSVGMIFAPKISELFHDGRIKELTKIYQALTKWITYINLIFFSIIILFSESIMRIFGSEYIAGASALILIGIGQFANSAAGTAGEMIVMTGKSKIDFYINLGSMIVNVFLNILLIPVLGIEGAAIASLVSFSTANITRVIFVYKFHGIFPYNRKFLKIIPPIVIPVVVVYFLNTFFNFYWFFKLVILILIFLFITFALYYLIAISKEDKIILKAVKNKLG